MKDEIIVEKNVKDEEQYCLKIFKQSCNGKKLMAKAHYHDDIEMIYATEGSFDVFLNSVMYTFSEGDLLIINSREIHRIIGKSDGENSYIWFRVASELVCSAEQSIFEIKYVLPFLMANAEHEKVIPAHILDNSGIPEVIYEMYNEYSLKQYGFELAIKSNICKVFLWILRYWHNDGVNLNIDETNKRKTAVDLSKVFSYVSENYSSEIMVSDMAKICCMSYSYFSRIFRETTGQTFSEYVNFIRLREAQRLLATTELSVTEVAFRTGFSSSSHFVCRFRKVKGLTPKQFKKQFALFPQTNNNNL